MRILAIAALTLAACSSGIIADPGTSYGPRGRGDGCDAARYQTLVGQPRTTLQGMSLPAPVRLIGPDTAVTMDYDPGRLNIRYDEQGIIVEVSCG